MAVSANALFHFTKDLETIKSILQNGFYPRYCMEKKEFLEVSPVKNLQNTASPMICFCDIPLSLVKNHVSRYGGYGVGIKKNLILNELHPVVYVSSSSAINKFINYSYAAIRKYQPRTDKRIREMSDSERELFYLSGEALDAIHYMKPYKGKNWINKSFSGPEICFYDEREWRYVPSQAAMIYADANRFISKEAYLEFKDELNKKLESIALPINAKVIEYIIVAKNNDVSTMVNHIMDIDNICGNKLTAKSKGMLCSRIISMQRIESDF